MKKTLLLLLISVFTFSAQAQSTDETLYYNGIESYKEINLTAQQRAKIEKLNREIGPQFAAIGKNRSLSGYEKGQRKRALALKHKEDIRKILTEDQLNTWEKRYGRLDAGKGIKDSMTDNYDAKLEALERRYDQAKDRIEDDSHLSKSEKKYQKKVLKDQYKADKERLKDEKKAVKNTVLLR